MEVGIINNEQGIGKKELEWTNRAKVVCLYYAGECLFIAKRNKFKNKIC